VSYNHQSKLFTPDAPIAPTNADRRVSEKGSKFARKLKVSQHNIIVDEYKAAGAERDGLVNHRVVSLKDRPLVVPRQQWRSWVNPFDPRLGELLELAGRANANSVSKSHGARATTAKSSRS